MQWVRRDVERRFWRGMEGMIEGGMAKKFLQVWKVLMDVSVRLF
jgi:hypothetical protein